MEQTLIESSTYRWPMDRLFSARLASQGSTVAEPLSIEPAHDEPASISRTYDRRTCAHRGHDQLASEQKLVVTTHQIGRLGRFPIKEAYICTILLCGHRTICPTCVPNSYRVLAVVEDVNRSITFGEALACKVCLVPVEDVIPAYLQGFLDEDR